MCAPTLYVISADLQYALPHPPMPRNFSSHILRRQRAIRRGTTARPLMLRQISWSHFSLSDMAHLPIDERPLPPCKHYVRSVEGTGACVMRLPALTRWTLVGLTAVCLIVGGFGGALLFHRGEQTCIALQAQTHAQQAARVAGIVEAALARGMPPSEVTRRLQVSLESAAHTDLVLLQARVQQLRGPHCWETGQRTRGANSDVQSANGTSPPIDPAAVDYSRRTQAPAGLPAVYYRHTTAPPQRPCHRPGHPHAHAPGVAASLYKCRTRHVDLRQGAGSLSGGRRNRQIVCHSTARTAAWPPLPINHSGYRSWYDAPGHGTHF